MKNVLLMTGIILAFSTNAMAQVKERQVYSPYPQPVMNEAQDASSSTGSAVNRYEQLHPNRVYPGREGYGSHYGPIPRHPGDYRDAVDRGQWSSGTNKPNSLFSVD